MCFVFTVKYIWMKEEILDFRLIDLNGKQLVVLLSDTERQIGTEKNKQENWS